jgi:dTDP-glucose 4,6-dehydratase
MRKFATLLITGGAGFIGSNLIRYLFEKADYEGRVVNVDTLSYAGNVENLVDIEKRFEGSRYFFVKADVCDRSAMEQVFTDYSIDAVCHLAAESHVDRSILGPEAFIKTNVMGTYTLLDVARKAWEGRDDVLFHHVSTDEVFGSLGERGFFTEDTPYDPRSPYSASKASSDHLVRAYYHTYSLPVTITNCSNNYGPYQFPEKLIPLMILNMMEGNPLPVYGDGRNVRDWLYVEDHNSALWTVMQKGISGQTYTIGGDNEGENIKLLDRIIELVSEESGKNVGDLRSLITFVKDRPGHDRRYAIDCSKLKNELGWKQSIGFDNGLRNTVRWYLDNFEWIAHVRSGEYQTWMKRNYTNR